MASDEPATDAGGMHHSSPRNRIRAAMIPAGSMQTVNILLAVAAALCIVAGVAGTIAR
jgi:hypothetical protein